MFAVVETGGKQYSVTVGSIIEVETLAGVKGDAVEFKDVLLVSAEEKINVGTPHVKGALVKAKILEQKRGPKKIIFKKIRRHGKRLKKGHRQELSRVKIEEICIN